MGVLSFRLIREVALTVAVTIGYYNTVHVHNDSLGVDNVVVVA